MVSGTWQAIHPTFQFRYRFLYIVNTLRRLTHLEYLRQDKPNASKCCGDSTYYCSYYLYEIHYIITFIFERATNILNNLCIPALSRLFLIKSSVGGRDHYQKEHSKETYLSLVRSHEHNRLQNAKNPILPTKYRISSSSFSFSFFYGSAILYLTA